MPKKINWKKGMRLTDEIMRMSDDAHLSLTSRVLMTAASQRMGLLPALKPFDVSLNVTNESIDVETLCCLAVTRDGRLIDIDYDTRYTQTQDVRVVLPANASENASLILIAFIRNDGWRETDDGFEEQAYGFTLTSPSTPVPDNAVPIARIVANPYSGWQQDDVDFVPPCLLITSHRKFQEQYYRLCDFLANADTKSAQVAASAMAKEVAVAFWPTVRQLRIVADKERDTLTPMQMLSILQQCVSVFVCGCQLTGGTIVLNEEDSKTFNQFVEAPYNYQDVYTRVNQGLEICFSINTKLDVMAQAAPPPPPPPPSPAPGKLAAPTIASKYLKQECQTSTTSIPVEVPSSKATVTFTIDGSDPTLESKKMGKNGKISFPNGFAGKGSEPDKVVTLKLCAFVGHDKSEVSTYNIQLVKSLNSRFWLYEI